MTIDLAAGAGTSARDDTAAAVAEAVAAARAGLGGLAPGLAVLWATVDHDPDRVHAALAAALPGVPLHGGTSSLGVLGSEGVVMGAGGSVGVMLLASRGGTAFASGSALLGDDPRAAGRRAAEAVASGLGGAAPRVLLITATPGCEEEVLRGAGEVFPGTPIFGGSAADHVIEGAWRVFTAEGARDGAVSMAAVGGEARVGAAFGGPYQPAEASATVTEVRGRTIVTLDGRAATEVLHGWLGDAVAEPVKHGGNLLVQTALSPLGIEHASDEGTFHLLLHPAQAHPDGSLDVFASPPPGATLCLMRGTEASLVGAVGGLADRALAAGGMRAGDVRAALLVYCAGCAGAIGRRLDEVLTTLRGRIAGAPVLGMCSFGEQGHVPGVGNVHSNLSVGVVLLG